MNPEENEHSTRIGAYAVLRKDANILLCHLTTSGRWTLPGGGIEPGEGPQQAMIREVTEETGLEVMPTALLGANCFTLREDSSNHFHNVQIVYTAAIIGGNLRFEIDGTTDMCQWHPIDEVNKLEVVELVQYSLFNLLDRPRLSR
jgi:8-oxo-dGTP pyrophosphatase MutT (NUDIX family)